MRILAIWSIQSYQKYVSPRKGFKCAHAAFYDGNSCSSAVIELLQTVPLVTLSYQIMTRFQECKYASIAINKDKQKKRKRRKKQEQEPDIDCCFPLIWLLIE